MKHTHEADTCIDESVLAGVESAENENSSTKVKEEYVKSEAADSKSGTEQEKPEEDQMAVLEKKVSELKDLYVRAQAELQNAQKRSLEEVKKARDYAISSFAKDIIVVKDYLEMALKDQSGNFETLKVGVDLTLKQLVQVFERHFIKEVCPNKSDKLDPNLHQAMNTVEEEGAESNTIVSVMQKGYILNERVLRPAMVTVAK